MVSKRSHLDEALATLSQRIKNDPTNLALANHYWQTLGKGDYRSGRYVMEAYRLAALSSIQGGAALAKAYRELFLVSGETPRPQFFDERLVEALKSYIREMPEPDCANLRWVLESIGTISLEIGSNKECS
jgi:hypothetical protein